MYTNIRKRWAALLVILVMFATALSAFPVWRTQAITGGGGPSDPCLIANEADLNAIKTAPYNAAGRYYKLTGDTRWFRSGYLWPLFPATLTATVLP